MHEQQQTPTKSFNISDTSFYISWTCYILIEMYSLYRFATLCKSQNVVGTEQGYFGVLRDNSDPQWREFSGHLVELLGFQIIFLILSQSVKYFTNQKYRKQALQYFNIIIGLGYSLYIHSIGMFFQLSIIILFYIFQKICYKWKYFVHTLWVLVILVLWFNESHNGYSFSMFSEELQFLDDYKSKTQLVMWNLVFNMILLRIISFSVDKVWASQYYETQKYDQMNDERRQNKTYKKLTEEHQKLEEYNFLGYLSFLFYAPLLFSGPSMGFNAFNSQLKVSQQNINRAQVIKYVLRVYLIDLLTFELLIHMCYPNAIPKVSENISILRNFTLFELHVMGCTNLVFIWYKFLIIWRIARSWALMDGVETPENMNRCVFNTYNFSGFWRSWHRSFNQWLIRYIYVPLGGSKYKQFNMWAVFTFVALWHDFKLDLLLWAWIICLALLPEIALLKYFDKEYFYRKWWFLWICRLGGGFQIEMMCLANLIGFGSGHEGMRIVLEKYLSWEGLIFFAFYVVVRNGFSLNIQFKIRDCEQAKLIGKNY